MFDFDLIIVTEMQFGTQDLNNMGVKKVCVVTDKNLEKLPPVRAVLDSLHANKVVYDLFSDVTVEPTDHRYVIIHLMNYAESLRRDLFVLIVV